jgi:hypothetical protein
MCEPLLDRLVKGCKPGFSVRVGKRNAAAHFFYIGGGMKAVGVVEFEIELAGEERANGGFACPLNAHDKHDHATDLNRETETADDGRP